MTSAVSQASPEKFVSSPSITVHGQIPSISIDAHRRIAIGQESASRYVVAILLAAALARFTAPTARRK